jgi:fructokinase
VNHQERRSETNVLVVGEALIDRVIRPDGVITESPGGSPANVALILGRLGRNPTFLTSVGRDADGETLSAWLAASGVDLRNVGPNDAKTAIASAYLDDRGDAHYEFDIVWSIEGDVDITEDLVHAGSISALLQPGAAEVLRLIHAARRRSTITYDPNIRPALLGAPETVVPLVEELVGLADIVKASEEDLQWLYPQRTVEDASTAWLALGPSVVVVTRGSKGAFAIAAAGRVDCNAEVVVVADTVGAGDTFMGAFIDGLMTADLCGAVHRAKLREISRDTLAWLVRRGGLAAAVTVSRTGVDPPWQHEIEFPSQFAPTRAKSREP